jgi:L-lactate dehydrogenase complex protein LldF
MEGLERAGVLATASSLCNACEDVCPVKIPIPRLLRRLRHDMAAGDGTRDPAERLAWKGWQLMNRVPLVNALVLKAGGLLGSRLPAAGPLKAWTSVRTPPRPAAKSLHELVRQERGVDDE